MLSPMQVRITVINAVLFRNLAIFSRMDPYIIVTLGQERYQSQTIDYAGTNVTWNQSFLFNNENNDLKLTVMKANTFTDELIGEGNFHIGKFRRERRKGNIVVKLYFQGKQAGKVQLNVQGSIQENFTDSPSLVFDAFSRYMLYGTTNKKEPTHQIQQVKKKNEIQLNLRKVESKMLGPFDTFCINIKDKLFNQFKWQEKPPAGKENEMSPFP